MRHPSGGVRWSVSSRHRPAGSWPPKPATPAPSSRPRWPHWSGPARRGTGRWGRSRLGLVIGTDTAFMLVALAVVGILIPQSLPHW